MGGLLFFDVVNQYATTIDINIIFHEHANPPPDGYAAAFSRYIFYVLFQFSVSFLYRTTEERRELE